MAAGTVDCHMGAGQRKAGQLVVEGCLWPVVGCVAGATVLPEPALVGAVGGMAGGLMTIGIENLPKSYELINLFTPHGWALRGWKDGRRIFEILGRDDLALWAEKEYEAFRKTMRDLGVTGPVHHTLAYHWARVIELQYAAERMLELAKDKSITSDDIRGPWNPPKEGVGICEAPRDTLIHHYASDKDGLCTKINMIVATTNNYAAMNTSVRQAAKALIHNGMVSQGLLNKVEMAFRCYDPCNSCGTHALDGGPALEVTVRKADGSVAKTLRNF